MRTDIVIRPAVRADALEWQRMRVLLLPEDVDAESEIEAYFAAPPPHQITLMAECETGSETALIGFVGVGIRALPKAARPVLSPTSRRFMWMSAGAAPRSDGC